MERIVFDDKTENEVCENAANSKEEDSGTPTIERRDVFLWWQSNDFVLVDSVSMMLYGIAYVRVPLVNKHRVMHHCNRHAVVQVNTIMVVDVANDNAVIARSGDNGCSGLAGRAKEQETERKEQKEIMYRFHRVNGVVRRFNRQVRIFGSRIETGTGFGCKVTVSVNGCIREPVFERCKQGTHGFTLCRCACISRFAFVIQSADIADAYAVGVMPFAMCSDGGERSACFDSTVHQNEVVVANVAKATLPMPPAHIVHIDMRQRFGGSAMDDDRIDCAHNDWIV